MRARRKPQFRRPKGPPTLAAIIEREREEAELPGPTPERKRHGPISRDGEQTADSAGNIGRPWRVELLLESWQAAGHITPREAAAGLEFQRIFALAGLDALKAADPTRVIVANGGVYDAPTAQSEWARRKVNAALDAVGGGRSAAGLALWYVLGLGYSMAEFETREGFAERPLDRRTSKGAIVGALGVLERFFGLT